METQHDIDADWTVALAAQIRIARPVMINQRKLLDMVEFTTPHYVKNGHTRRW